MLIGQLTQDRRGLQVALPHPEATAALIKGGTELTAHFGNPPFQNQVLAGNPYSEFGWPAAEGAP